MEYKNTLDYSVPFEGASFQVTAKVLGYNELHDWVQKWKNPTEEARSDDDVLNKVLSVGLKLDGKDIEVAQLKELDHRIVRGVVTGYLKASGVIPEKADAEKKDNPTE